MSRRLGFLRARNVAALSALTALVAACGFGVDLDGIFGGTTVGPGDGDGSVDGTIDGPASDATIPKVEVVQLGVGDDFACGRRADGTVMCWGSGRAGQLGDNLDTHASKPVLVKDINDAIELSVGDDHACAVKRDETVVCWGQNDLRQLGDGTQNDALVPRAVVNLTGVAKVAAAGDSTCALKKDGTVQCWGDNTQGQLGDNTTTFHATAAPVQGLTDVTQIAATFFGICALNKAGEVYCWGDNSEGLSGLGTSANNTLVPTKVPDLAGVAALGNGPSAYHFCAVLNDGSARCWGDANSGQIGNAQGGEMQTKPQQVVGLVDAASITMGESFTCALRKSGEVSCWGTNGFRQLGQGDGTQPGGTNSPVPVAGLTGIQQIASGVRHTCALHTGGQRISCWGGNLSGALGRDTRLASEVPLKVAGVPAVAKVGLGRDHSCVTSTTGEIWCWGLNDYRQQASSAFYATGTPTKITAISGAQKIIGGEIHTCGLFGTEVKCWGHGSEGTLGNGGTPYLQADPVTFNSAAATDVNAGYHFTCALLSNKQVACAGNNDDGRVGSAGGNATTPRIVQVANPAAGMDAGADADPDADAGPPPPALIPFDNVDRIGVGRLHTCAVHGGGKVSCWGTPWDGRLGTNTGTFRTNPIGVSSITTPGATEIAAGFDHSCAILSDGSVRCWGSNSSGQVTGGGGSGAQLRTPNLNGKTAKAIAAGDAHTCIIQNDDTVACWGRGRDGQLGQGVRVDANQPVSVMGLAGVVSLDAEGDRTCAATSDGSLYCWGDNSTGNLGDGTVMHTGVPAPIAGYE